MLARRIREEFEGKQQNELEDLLIKHYPLGEMKQKFGKLYFYTGISSNVTVGGMTTIAQNDFLIETGMYVDDDDKLRIYDQELKIG